MIEDIAKLCDDFYERASEIPFGNSDYQNERLVIAQHTEPTRAYRQILLEINKLISALQEAHYNHKEQQIDEREMLWKLENDKSLNEFDKERISLKLEKNAIAQKQSEKLIKDALHSLGLYNNNLKKFPKYTREDFEALEQQHFEQVLLNPPTAQMKLERAKAGLKLIEHKIDLKELEQGS